MLMHLLTTALNWNFVLVTAISASLTAQLIKVLLNLFIFHRFIAERMWGAGGMPSSHSATVCAMVVATGRYCGVNSAVFAVAAVLSIIVMYDAMGVRYETGEQAKLLNRMFTEWMDQGSEALPFLKNGKKLKEMVGHTPIEVLTGAVLGILIGFAMPMP
ncbi:divergent PAP2 family protein [uncultured Gemmiger sp.]|uniref:divergent PAP2 family protein n=1 Tax=uncultured Gemmiger sp. TaxID=1623490 RepID=UPI0027DD22A8|nr:divergent PAP2 family protein [uncultured Gemmiger sp.]